MPNFPGVKPYPLYAATGPTPMLDVCDYIKGAGVSIPRGGTTPDYNIKLRGRDVRIDRIPERPYP